MNATAVPKAIQPGVRAGGWIVAPARRTPPALRLFCLPYAAGAASVYTGWSGALGEHIEVCPVEYPGRQTRWRESPHARLAPLVDELASALEGELDVPYALFGHSMGSLVAFELARELRRRGAGEPHALFVSGGRAPRLRHEQPRTHDQPDAFVVDRLRRLGGLPGEVCDEPELLELLMPAIRADFAVCETYEYRAEPLLTCPVVAFAGTEDPEVPAARMAPWAEETTGPFVRYELPGDHFFLRPSRTPLLDTVRAALTPCPTSYTRQEHR
ncbi:thioesterase II family protein [Streptomyces lanatus]|uniref:Alpha/beta fold hydrolase n=1 Tax=Streptomyces lanatus TaxID=66900 RepID=A0ABV1XHW3_9ACTN|nr:alpha/beta fold hydrolase [Streptomyces lanatus]GHG93813.1 thioesterase [Streptomyces lanatus]